MKNKEVIKMTTTIFLVLFFALFISSITYQKEIGNKLGSSLESYGAVVLFLIAFIIELIPNYVSPHIGIINAYVLNISIKTTISFLLLGSILGSLLGFELGKKYGTKLAKNFLEKKNIKKIEDTLNKKGRWGVLLAAISPIPYLPIVLGSIKFLRKNFIIFGIIPRSISIIIITLIIYSLKL